ncbi:MAG TPA: nucleotidyltransferase family protein [Candidatus Ozemobacteraceae bacterium]|nr:nucleotidyltransferase family protein [Candidatus Ozemobacteraceae bacterium]HQG27510.1 nucleotidyltransferase family protein [Candidatus Ozemobacteraceae bacterium]
MSRTASGCSSGPAVICLLAGHSSRMGRPKQHLVIAGRTFLEHLLARLSGVRDRLGPLCFVGQAHDDEGREAIFRFGGRWIVNPAPGDGPLSSIRLALAEIPEGRGFLLWPVDHPLVAVSTLEALLDAIGIDAERIVAPSDGERRGHPSYFPAWAREELLSCPLEAGAKLVLQRHPDLITHVVSNDPWIRRNINTPELLAEAEQELTRSGP